MTEQTATVELLPKGAFYIRRIDGTTVVHGRFTTTVLDAFCDKYQLGSYFDLLPKIAVGLTIGQYGELLAMSVKSEQWDKAKALEFIDDEFDGIKPELFKLINHAMGRLGNLVNTDNKDAGADTEDKKKELISSPPGEPLHSSATAQE